MEVNQAASVVNVQYQCDVCNIGLLIYNEQTSSVPPVYKHTCPNCGNIEGLPLIYPYFKNITGE